MALYKGHGKNRGRTIFIEIHPNEKMPVFRPHSKSGKITKTIDGRKVEGTRKTKEILD